MTDKLLNSRPAGSPPPQFQIVDVNYFKIGSFYRCQFSVKLTRPDGTDTIGIIQAKVSTDYQTVVK